MSMGRHKLDDILRPLAIAVIIDHRVRTPEKTAYVEQAQGLLEFFEHEAMSEADLLAWFEAHRAELTAEIDSAKRNTIILKALTRFTDDADVEAVYDALLAISISDKKFVREESEFIKSAATIWGFQRPPLKVDKP